MFRSGLFLVFIILRAQANVRETENPEIRLSYNRDSEEIYKVWKNKPLKIIIENGNTRHVWCYNKYKSLCTSFEKFVPETKFTNGDIRILNITHVTPEMSTRWACTALEDYHGPVTETYENVKYTTKNLHFHLHVREARGVILTANEQSLTYITANLSVNYDGTANYTYGDSEGFPMDFSCKKMEDSCYNEDTLHFEYYNAKGILLLQTKPSRTKQPQLFRSALKSNNDKYYLDCIRTADNPTREYRYRTTFFKNDLSDAVQHAVVLTVNDQKLTATLSTDKSYDNYTFRYIDGEVLIVTCQKVYVDMSGSLIIHFDEIVKHMDKASRSDNPSEAVVSLNTSVIDIKNKYLTCGINNTDVVTRNAKLLFLSDVPDNGVRIRGLPRNNILCQYRNDIDQWTIVYQYSVNDSLDLTCVWHEGFKVPRSLKPYENPFLWEFQGHKFDSAAIETPNTPNYKFTDIQFTTVLNATHNGTKIKCTYCQSDYNYSKTIEIILRIKPELLPEMNGIENVSGDIPVSMIVPIAVGIGAAITIIMMVCLVSWHKRTKRINLIENAFDNLSNQDDSPIPAFPRQWEANDEDLNYAKIDEEVMQDNYNYSTCNGKLNSMSYKRQSNTNENHYTEIDDSTKPKPGGLKANWNPVQPSNYKKQTDTPKGTASHSSNNACHNKFSDSKQGTYDKLRHSTNDNEHYSNVQKLGKSKNVTFRQMSNDSRNNAREVKPNNDVYYANTGKDEIQSGDMHKKSNYENYFLQNEITDNPFDSDYAEPYEVLGKTCKNNFYGSTRANQ